MSTPPFLDMDERRRRRARARSRRARRRTVAAAVIAVAALTVALSVMLANGSGSAHPHGRQGHDAPRSPAAAPARSQDGFALAHPELALSGLTQPASDPVQIYFHHPPRAGLLFNLDTGQVLWQRNAALRLPMASLTKMMTALVSVQSAPAGALVKITRQAIAEGGSKVGVLPLGKRVRLESLLYGLMLPSGNDAAVALAQYVAGSIKAFVVRMNEQAARLGMGCTRYSSPSGFYDAGNYTCATDLAELAHADLAQPRIARVVHTYTAAIPFPIKGGKLYLTNNNPMLIYGYPGTTGLKTGYTIAAGRCLVATAERHGVRLGVVLLNSSEPGTQAKRLLDHGFLDVYGQAPVPELPFPTGA